jgi:ADP-dependent NAD(P)H-hydrate dehydratase / NAD(P)H-hydrate epimerase
VATKVTTNHQILDESLALSLIPQRNAGDHKWAVGGLVIIGGAPGYIGAPALCAKAAGRSGAGIVSVAVSRSSVGPIAALVPEATFLPLPDGDAQTTTKRAVEHIRERVDKSRAIVVGPGLSQDDQARALLTALFGLKDFGSGSRVGFGIGGERDDQEESRRVVGGSTLAVIDADALNWLASQNNWWDRLEPMSMVLTPHAAEFARLLDTNVERVTSDPAAIAIEAAANWRQVVLLKGAEAVLTDGDEVRIGVDTPPSLATAGSGDVLAGSIGAFLAQGLSLLDAASLALYIGSVAARSIEMEFGTLGLVAGDLPDAIARTLASLERTRASTSNGM